MNKEINNTFGMVELPVSSRLKPIRNRGYGSVEGLPDEELLTPDELERMVFNQEFSTIMTLPARKSKGVIRTDVDEDGGIGWGAFGTVDFDRYRSHFDNARYRAEKLSERIKDRFIILEMVRERIPGMAKNLVIKYLDMGIIELEHIADMDMYSLAKLYLQIQRLQKECAEAKEAGRARQSRRLRIFLES